MEALNFRDVALVPNECKVQSRSQCDISAMLGPYKFTSPVIPANMKSVITPRMVVELALQNRFYIMHRFGVDQLSFVKSMHDKNLKASISVGVKNLDRLVIDQLSHLDECVEFVTLDIAHSHSKYASNMIQYIKKYLPHTFVIAGNVCTQKGARFLKNAGADAVKVGIGPGSQCTTKLQTGFWCPQFTAIQDCRSVLEDDYPIIGDGGLQHYGDIAKAIVAGATFVMSGAFFAGLDESEGLQYYGSASANNKQHDNHIEGKMSTLEPQGSLSNRLKDIDQALKSSISYAGGKDLSALRNVEYKVVKSP